MEPRLYRHRHCTDMASRFNTNSCWYRQFEALISVTPISDISNDCE